MNPRANPLQFSSPTWLRLAFAGTLLTLVLHCLVLWMSGQNGVATPISQLSRHEWGGLHSLGLLLFSGAHIALAAALRGLDSGGFWPFARTFLIASGLTLVYVAYYFAAADNAALYGEGANDPLWIVASLTGLAMAALQPGFKRLSLRLGRFNAFCLGIWLLLVPVAAGVNPGWLGAYERIVGAVYVVWLAGVPLGLIGLTPSAAADSN